MAMLEVSHLGKKFDHTQVLRDINFTLEKCDSLAIIGSSGSGKTTLLRCLNYLETPDSGKIVLNGQTLFDGSASAALSAAQLRKNRLHFGLVFQSFNLFPQYTAFQNVVLAGELLIKGQERDKASRKAQLEQLHEKGRALLASVGLQNKADNYPHQLSGGQQQRVAIARALAMEPDILCFDEPTSALDPELTGEVLSVIRSLAAQNMTMIIVTHEMQFARQVADNVLFMDEGVVVEYGRAQDVIDHPTQARTKRFLENYQGL